MYCGIRTDRTVSYIHKYIHIKIGNKKKKVKKPRSMCKFDFPTYLLM